MTKQNSLRLNGPFKQVAKLSGLALALGVAAVHFSAVNATQTPASINSAAQPALSAGTVFADYLSGGLTAPELIVVPAGQFVMGSPETEDGRYADEGPQRTVQLIKPFSLGRTEVTVGDFRAFVESTGYVSTAERQAGSYLREPESGAWKLDENINWRFDNLGKPAGDRYPVVHVSWEDAQAYTKWLSRQTGQSYRLPTEAELEYANRAGTQTVYPWGDGSPSAAVANIKGEKDLPLIPAALHSPSSDEFKYAFREGYTSAVFKGYGDGFGSLAPVGTFAANKFGLHDTTGNVWEWTADCWHDSYDNAPTDGSAWTTAKSGDCGRRVMRGGSYYCYPRHDRAANRWAEVAAFRNMYVGFRVARDL